jgi:HEAT repeat protein
VGETYAFLLSQLLEGVAREICPNCAQRISSWNEKAFTEKLIQALSHPEPETPARAVYILGEKKTAEAVGPLARLFRRSRDPFLQSEIMEAMGKIGGEEALALLMEALRHPSFIVRGEAVKALSRFPGNGGLKRALEQSLKDPSSYVQEIGREAIGRLRALSLVKGD